jgi:2-succinyl-6-hydroxy-2,4-cyclohexadiene-1-carboxylate synthase
MQDWNQQPVFKDSKALDLKETDFTRQQLANALLGWSLGLQEDLQDSIKQLNIPLLWIAGAKDTKFTALTRSLQLKHPKSRTVIVQQAGHRAIWDAPDQVKQSIQHFIEDCYAYESHLA